MRENLSMEGKGRKDRRLRDRDPVADREQEHWEMQWERGIAPKYLIPSGEKMV